MHKLRLAKNNYFDFIIKCLLVKTQNKMLDLNNGAQFMSIFFFYT